MVKPHDAQTKDFSAADKQTVCCWLAKHYWSCQGAALKARRAMAQVKNSGTEGAVLKYQREEERWLWIAGWLSGMLKGMDWEGPECA